ACAESQQLSFRKSQKNLSQDARVDSLLSHSTVWNLKQSEEKRLEKVQRRLIANGLKEHGEILERHGFLPSPSPEERHDDLLEELSPEDRNDDMNHEDIHIEEEAKMLAHHFMSQTREITHENKVTDVVDSVKNTKPRCHVPPNVIPLQADEVVTKSQEAGQKTNKTFTATLEDGTGRKEYLAARTAESLQFLVAVILAFWGLFTGKHWEVISDGATWIGKGITRLTGVEVYHILCWYHLCKRVCSDLSGLGVAKEEREKHQREILGCLWKGNVTDAVILLKELLPRCRVRSRVEGLIDYLIRKRSGIADYESRHDQGLWIASTRVEKWNDVAVSERCKHRGMSWTETGVLAIALHAAEIKRKITQNTHLDRKTHT
ncbi:MAG: hypothetical protein FWH27_09730, partial [Planctomycetaceae bacterium]|nr:hypothetical protein [Planctomycetaceae bacterium]